MKLAKKHVNQRMRAASLFSKAGHLHEPGRTLNHHAVATDRVHTPKAMWGMDDGLDSKTTAQEMSRVQTFIVPQSPGKQQLRTADAVPSSVRPAAEETAPLPGPPRGPQSIGQQQAVSTAEMVLEEL